MKWCVAQTAPIKGNIASNIAQHEALIELALSSGATAIFFPELSLTGYEPTLAEQLAIRPNDPRLDRFQSISNQQAIAIGLGAPTPSEHGVCISLILFQPHQPRQTISKHYLHPDEEPYFVPGRRAPVLQIGATRLALAICFELSVPDHATAAHADGAELYIASVAKSPHGVAQAHARLATIANTYGMTVLLANSVGMQDEFVGAGGSAAWTGDGVRLGQLDDVTTGILVYDDDKKAIRAYRLYETD
jgi:predicted amidohydrolase